MRLVVALLVRQEAGPDRYLARVLTRCAEFADDIVVLDDGSTDGTPELAKRYGAHVHHREMATPAWGHESFARMQLWDLASSYCQDADSWVLVCDADQLLVGDVRSLCLTRELNTWSFVLYDCWSATEYRSDQFWQAHQHHRPWLFAPKRVPSNWVPMWGERGIHPGHAPLNWPMVTGFAPADEFYWLHLGWSRPEHREAKYRQYKSTFHLMSDAEKAHVESILQ